MPRKRSNIRRLPKRVEETPLGVAAVIDVIVEESSSIELIEELAPEFSSLADADPAACVRGDSELARRCVEGDVGAWEQLHADCHLNLLATARRLLRGRSNDPNLAEEIVAQVWYALVANDGELLLRFDPTRGARLMTFLRAIVRDLLSRHFRSESRRMGRECESQLDRPQHHSDDLDHADISLGEFLRTLSPSERAFFDEYLFELPTADGTGSGLSPNNVWQKTHRIYNKFCNFFGRER